MTTADDLAAKFGVAAEDVPQQAIDAMDALSDDDCMAVCATLLPLSPGMPSGAQTSAMVLAVQQAIAVVQSPDAPT